MNDWRPMKSFKQMVDFKGTYHVYVPKNIYKNYVKNKQIKIDNNLIKYLNFLKF